MILKDLRKCSLGGVGVYRCNSDLDLPQTLELSGTDGLLSE